MSVDEALDGWQIAVVKSLRHRVENNRHSCKCEECRAIVRVCALASEALAMKAAKRRRDAVEDARQAHSRITDEFLAFPDATE